MKKLDNKYIGIVTFVVLVILIVIFVSTKKNNEQMENLNLTNQQQVLVDKIYNYITSKNSEYSAYLDLLQSNNNVSVNLVKLDIYNKFLELTDKNELTKILIAQEILKF